MFTTRPQLLQVFPRRVTSTPQKKQKKQKKHRAGSITQTHPGTTITPERADRSKWENIYTCPVVHHAAARRAHTYRGGKVEGLCLTVRLHRSDPLAHVTLAAVVRRLSLGPGTEHSDDRKIWGGRQTRRGCVWAEEGEGRGGIC